jgi:ABC-2 type transport system permease protein
LRSFPVGPESYGLVGLAFVWELFGSLLEVPDWLLAVSPFHDVGLVPAEPFGATAAAIMLALAATAALVALWAFQQRDLTAS